MGCCAAKEQDVSDPSKSRELETSAAEAPPAPADPLKTPADKAAYEASLKKDSEISSQSKSRSRKGSTATSLTIGNASLGGGTTPTNATLPRKSPDQPPKIIEIPQEGAARDQIMHEALCVSFPLILVEEEQEQTRLHEFSQEIVAFKSITLQFQAEKDLVERALGEVDSIDDLAQSESSEDDSNNQKNEELFNDMFSVTKILAQADPNVFDADKSSDRKDSVDLEPRSDDDEEVEVGNHPDGTPVMMKRREIRKQQKQRELQEAGSWGLFFNGETTKNASPGERARSAQRRKRQEKEIRDRREANRARAARAATVRNRLGRTNPELSLGLEEATCRDTIFREELSGRRSFVSEFVPIVMLWKREKELLSYIRERSLLLQHGLQRIEALHRISLENAFSKEVFPHLEKMERYIAARREWERERREMGAREDSKKLKKLAARGALGNLPERNQTKQEQKESWKQERLRLGKAVESGSSNDVLHSKVAGPRGRLLEKITFAAKEAVMQEEAVEKRSYQDAAAASRTASKRSTPTDSIKRSFPNALDRSASSVSESSHGAYRLNTSRAQSKYLNSLKPHAPSLERLKKKMDPLFEDEDRIRSSIELESKLRFDLMVLELLDDIERTTKEEDARRQLLEENGQLYDPVEASSTNRRLNRIKSVHLTVTPPASPLLEESTEEIAVSARDEGYAQRLQKAKRKAKELSDLRIRVKKLESGEVKEKFLVNEAQHRFVMVEFEEEKSRKKCELHETRFRQEISALSEDSLAVVRAHDARRQKRIDEQQSLKDYDEKVERAKELISRVAVNAIFRARELYPVWINREELSMLISEETRSFKMLVQYELAARVDIVEFWDLEMARGCGKRGEHYKRLTTASVSPQSVPAVEKIEREKLQANFQSSFQREIVHPFLKEAEGIRLLPPEKVGYRVRAATKIQSFWRGCRSRHHFFAHQRDQLVIRRMSRLQMKQDVRYLNEIESLRRINIEDQWTEFDLFGSFFRVTMKRLESERLSAVKIQSLWRGYWFRRYKLPHIQERFYTKLLKSIKK